VHRSDAHTHGLVEQLVVQLGTVRIGPVDDLVVAEAGDSVIFAADVPHSYEALDAEARGVLLMHYPFKLAASTSAAPQALPDTSPASP
jgi:quercetin dioxygenase-like cupin family protein